MHQASAVSSSPPTSRRASPAPPFDCSWQAGGFGAAWVHVAGEVDLATSPQLLQALGEAQLDARLVATFARSRSSIVPAFTRSSLPQLRLGGKVTG